MREIVPQAKLILLLRDPVARAFSKYNHYSQILEQCVNWRWPPGEFLLDALKADRSMLVTLYVYCPHIANLVSLFPREQLDIALSECVRSHPGAAYD